jgi:MSHA biogenesis protein MshQ
MVRAWVVLSVLVLAASSANAAIPDCVGYWNFDEGQGEEAKDASATKNNGKLTGNPKWVDGKFGKALALNGTSACVVLTKELGQWLGKSGSLSCWIKTKQQGNETFWQAPAITGVEEAGGGDDIFWGWINQDGKIGLQAGDSEAALSSTVITDDKWHHVVLTRKEDSGEAKVYVDGKCEGTATSDTGAKSNTFNALGRRENTGGDPAYLDGALDEVKVFSRVLTQAEVETLFKNEDK